ncbi:29976_t:CDS:10 [Racocetra persica]|uniref:29976_t:CDS:1 n=1 Tax=Racocetra persica TaxID=160502 RepID=A0ACA9PBV7_9GLOM|nr:29976_t:CDS:10 [Racocetra persica]
MSTAKYQERNNTAMEFFERSEEWSLLHFLKYLDSVESLNDCSEAHHKYKLLLTSIKDDKEVSKEKRKKAEQALGRRKECRLRLKNPAIEVNESRSSEIKEFWRERNLRIVLKEKTVRSTEKIIDQINTVQDEASDVLVLGKMDNLRRLRSKIDNNEEDGCSNKRKRGMEKNETERPQTPEAKEEPSTMVLREQKKVCYAESSTETDSPKSDYEEFKDKNESTEKQYIRKVFDSREGTPCTTSYEVTNPIIVTPNKPVITNASYNQYSMHMICAFGSTLHLVKETTDKQLYEEIEKIIKMRNKSVLSSSIVKKLEVILQSDYSTIVSKIIAETEVEDNEITEDARSMSERTYIVECISPILRAFRNSFPDIEYEWIEKVVRSIKDATEILDIEVSGPPFNSTKKHTVGDAKKLLLLSVCSLCKILANNFDCLIEDAKQKYLAIELASCIIPFSFDAISCYARIFNFFAIIRNEFVKQEKIQKKIRSFIPLADNNNEDLREWVHQPDADLTIVTEDDIDELFL